MTMDLGFLTQSPLFADIFTLIITQGSYNEYDEFVLGDSLEYNLKGSVEPISGINRTNDVSGERSHETINISTTREELARALRQGGNLTKGDKIVYNTKTYIIKNVPDWRTHGFLDIVAIRKNGEAD